MKKALKFNTNIKCMGCVSAVTPALNEAVGAGNWEVDIQSPHKELTVTVENQDADTIIAALRETGYTAEAIEQAA
jgi:copper chaperone CopZ